MESSARDWTPDDATREPQAEARLSVGAHAGGWGDVRLGMVSADSLARPAAHDAAVAGTFAEELRPHQILTCVEWMRRHQEPVSEKLWEGTYQIALHGRSQRTRLIATRMLADRFDPIPRELPVERGPVTFNVLIDNSDTSRHEAQADGRGVRVSNSGRQGT